MVFAGTVYVPVYDVTPVARIISVVTAFGLALVILRSMTEGSVKLTDHEITRGCVGSIPEPEVGDVNCRADTVEKMAARQAGRIEERRISGEVLDSSVKRVGRPVSEDGLGDQSRTYAKVETQ